MSEAITPRERIILGAIIALALVVRLAFILGQRSDVLFDTPQLDEQRYVEEARAIVNGTPTAQDDLPYWQPPGMVYVLAATFKIAGPGLLVPRILLAVVSAASCLLLFALARRLSGVRVGLAAAATLALHGAVVFETYQLLPATFALAFDLAALLLLMIAKERESWRSALAAGLALGSSALFAATVLPFALVGAFALRRRRMHAVALLIGVALPIIPVTARNWIRTGEPVLVSANAGLNFYIGNNIDYDLTFSLRPGRGWIDLVEEPARRRGVTPGTASASHYFMGEGLAFFRDHPIDATTLLLRKTYLFLHGAEIPRDSDVYDARRSSTLLSALVWRGPLYFPDGLLIPLALVGIAGLWPQRRRFALPLAFLAIQLVFVAVFFVTARHRVPSVPLFALFAAAGVPHLVRSRMRWAGAAAFVALVIACNWPTWESRLSLSAEREMFRGLAYQTRRQLPDAVAALERATVIDASIAASWFELGNAYDAIGKVPQAVDAWSRAAALDPWDTRAPRREAVGRSRMGDMAGAIRALEAMITMGARDPAHYAPDHMNLALALARRGEIERALPHLRRAASDPVYLRGALPRMWTPLAASEDIRSPVFFRALAEVARAVGLTDLAKAADARAAELEPR